MKNSLQLVTTIVAVAALALSLWNFWFSQLRKLTLAITPEDEIRLRQFTEQTGWSMLFKREERGRI